MTARKDGQPHRPKVTEAELKAFYDACDRIREEEPEMSVRGYAYRIGGMATYDANGNVIDGIRLHCDICTKEPPAPGEDPVNSESIQRYVLYGRRTGRLPYDSVIDDTRPTSYASSGWRNRASAISYADNARKSMIAGYSLDIWTPQRKHVEVLSEKLALEPIVKRPAHRLEVDVTSCKGFSSESLLYRLARETVMRSVPTVYLLLVDLDKPGKDMVDSLERNIRRLLKMLARKLGRPEPDLTFVHIGLTLEQANSFDEVDLRPCKPSQNNPKFANYTPWCAEVDFCSSAHIDLHRPLALVDVTEGVGELGRRMAATRTIGRLDLGIDAKKYAAGLAARVLAEHRPGTRTLVMLNTVERAMEVHTHLVRLSPDAELVLLHSRFRPADRATNTAVALAEPGPGGGTIVVATQVLEAGVDVTSDLLITEVAPWPSIVQRAGRCNRDGRATNARLLWTMPPGTKAHLPYDARDLDSAAAGLTALAGRAMTGRELAEQDVPVLPVVHPVLRRRDLVDLFDTTPDLAGDDIDVSAFIRDADNRTVSVAWRRLDTNDMPAVDRSELCQAPIADVRDMIIRNGARGRIWDQVVAAWRPARGDDVRPTAVIVLDALRGGYSSERGFDPRSTQAVDPVTVESRAPDAFDRDPLSTHYGKWIALREHLVQTESAARALIDRFGADVDLTAPQRDAITKAALLHDLGKAHPTFQASLVNANPDAPPPTTDIPWAKSPGHRALRHDPRHFRHELVSALWLCEASDDQLDGSPEPTLVVYLVAAHHGKVRVTIRGLPDEPPDITLGVQDGSHTIGFDLNGRPIPSVALSLRPTTHGVGSLTSRAIALRDRADLGPFRLAFCEALVRAADWQASADGVR